MPRSRGRKKKKNKGQPIINPNKIFFRKLDFGAGEILQETKDAILKSARDDVDRYPELVDQITALLKEKAPEGVFSTFAFYGMRAFIDSSGGTESLTKDIQQHHIELLQGIVLSLPADEWGKAPSTAQAVQTAFDVIPKLADTFFKRRLIAKADERDEVQRAIMSLQEKIRLHTQAVRNWGYFSEVKKICREVYAPLDKKLAAAAGYSFSDIIDIAEAVHATIEDRGNAFMSAMSKLIVTRDGKALVERA
jgi:hypothetical protein